MNFPITNSEALSAKCVKENIMDLGHVEQGMSSVVQISQKFSRKQAEGLVVCS